MSEHLGEYSGNVSGGNVTSDVTVAPENMMALDDDLTQDPDGTESKTGFFHNIVMF